MCQRQPNDPDVQEEKSFDWSGLNSKGPSTVMSDGSASIAETRDEHAVDQIDGDVLNPFTLSGYPGDLPAGDYEVLVEEELLQGLSFEAYRRTATYLTVRGRGRNAGRSELRAISDNDLKEALSRDAALSQTTNHSEAALSPQEDRT
jgi:hypothetical protein